MVQVTQDSSDDDLTKYDIEELLNACYAMDAEHPFSGWAPLMPLVAKLKRMLEQEKEREKRAAALSELAEMDADLIFGPKA